MFLPSSGFAGEVPNLSLRLDSIYYGASLNHMSAVDTPNDSSSDGGGSNRVYIRNYPNMAYGIAPNLILGAVGRFDYDPLQQQDYKWKDSYVHLFSPQWIGRGNVSVTADFRVYAPLAAASRRTGEIVGLQTRFVPSYQVPGSRFTFGLILYQQFTARDGRSDTINAFTANATTSELYAGPNVSYQLSPTVALTCLYEMDAVRLTGDPFFHYISDTHSNNGYTDLEPALHWNVTSNIDLTPFLNLYPGSNFSLDTTSFNLWLALKVL
jgi:hypothetical protein